MKRKHLYEKETSLWKGNIFWKGNKFKKSKHMWRGNINFEKVTSFETFETIFENETHFGMERTFETLEKEEKDINS